VSNRVLLAFLGPTHSEEADSLSPNEGRWLNPARSRLRFPSVETGTLKTKVRSRNGWLSLILSSLYDFRTIRPPFFTVPSIKPLFFFSFFCNSISLDLVPITRFLRSQYILVESLIQFSILTGQVIVSTPFNRINPTAASGNFHLLSNNK
jgi:hypothetical protein